MKFYCLAALFSLGTLVQISLCFRISPLRHTQVLRASTDSSSIENAIMNTARAPLKQLQIRFNCDDVDSDDLSELLFEVGTLSVSVEVESEKDIINDQSKWADLIRTKSWDTALLRANFPASYNSEGLTDILEVAFPDVDFEFVVVDIEDKDWVSDVQKTWLPQVIGNLIVRFPWHVKEVSPFSVDENQKELVLEGGAAFGTGEIGRAHV